MSKFTNASKEVFNTMHKLEQAGMSRVQAETTARAVDSQVSNGIQLVLDKLDEVKVDLRLIKRENVIANTIIGIGFAGIIVSLIGIMFALLSIN